MRENDPKYNFRDHKGFNISNSIKASFTKRKIVK